MDERTQEVTDQKDLTIDNLETLALIAHFTICNKQIHSSQIAIINQYLEDKGLNEEKHYIMDVFHSNENMVPLNSAKNAFFKECPEIRSEIYLVLLSIGYVDGYMDQEEINFLKDIEYRIGMGEEQLTMFRQKAIFMAEAVRSRSNQIKSEQPSGFLQKFKKFLLHFVPGFMKKDKKMITTDQYRKAIYDCTVVAREDFQMVRPVYDQLASSGREFLSRLYDFEQSLDKNHKMQEEVTEVLKTFTDSFKTRIVKQIEDYRNEAYKKEHALSDFSIALLGRTKAGKTTLHTILTGEGKENIGIGMQRTTRYNRVYQWENLRIIDTPGIGSAESEGRTDDQIAESVLGEADIICFVMIDDSIQQDILEFICRIAQRNKPIMILLNYKENIDNEVKFEHFIKNPDRWYKDTGENSIKGHINRIQRYISEQGFSHIVSIYPVFLLAAMMSEDEKYKKYSKKLKVSSQIDPFLEKLKEMVVNNGALRRSQTIVNDTVFLCDSCRKSLLETKEPLRILSAKLKDKKKSAINTINSSKDKFLKSSKQHLENSYEKLATYYALDFAEKHYDQKSGLDAKWERYIKDIRFQDMIIEGIQEYNKEFMNSINMVLDELFEDIDYVYSNMNINTGNINLSGTFSFRGVSKLFGSALGLAGGIAVAIAATNPVGWILIGVGFIVGLFSNLFKSKEQKRKEAIDKIYSQLNENIRSNASEHINHTVSDLRKKCDNVKENIDTIFTDLIGQVDNILSMTEPLEYALDYQMKNLNMVYAFRILNCLEGIQRNLDFGILRSEIINVERDFGKTIKILTSIRKSYDMKRIKGIVKDNVIIETT